MLTSQHLRGRLLGGAQAPKSPCQAVLASEPHVPSCHLKHRRRQRGSSMPVLSPERAADFVRNLWVFPCPAFSRETFQGDPWRTLASGMTECFVPWMWFCPVFWMGHPTGGQVLGESGFGVLVA